MVGATFQNWGAIDPPLATHLVCYSRTGMHVKDRNSAKTDEKASLQAKSL